MSERKPLWKQAPPPAPLALLKAALLELLEIDTMHLEDDEQCPYILYSLADLFFQGKLYLSYDLTTGHLGWSPMPEATAERSQVRLNVPP